MSKRFPPIPQFVAPYPDESCYSILCRCMVRTAMSAARFHWTMFEKKNWLSCYLWQPFHVEDLTRWFDDATVRMAIYVRDHSCVPYRFPFLHAAYQEDFEDWANGEEMSNGIHHFLTMKLGYRKWTKRYLCYCPECTKVDRYKYGETYWHMIPQLPGVYVCPIHAVPLEESSLMLKNWIDLYPAEYWIPDVEPRRETISYDDLRLATDSKWMMEHGWGTAFKLKELIEGLSHWQFEQAEAKVKRLTSRESVKNETAYYILLANLKGNSIADYVDKAIVQY